MKVIVQKALVDGMALWPEMYTPEELEERRRQMGPVIFDLQYQNDAGKALGAVFREEWLHYSSEPPQEVSVYQGVDLAISTSGLADYFAIVTIGVTEDSNVYVLDAFRERLTFEKQAQAVVNKAREFDPTAIAIDSTGYQAALSQLLSERTLLPVKPVSLHKDKVTRAWRLSALFENGKVYLKHDQEALRDELLEFPHCEHDDLFDALEMATSVARGTFKSRLLSVPGT